MYTHLVVASANVQLAEFTIKTTHVRVCRWANLACESNAIGQGVYCNC